MSNQLPAPSLRDYFWARVFEEEVVLTGSYCEKEATKMTSALQFWWGVRNISKIYHRFCEEYAGQEVVDFEAAKRALLDEAFQQEENGLVTVVAITEKLPTKVWRRVLWQYNIDFMSFEAFLRRLTKDQLKDLATAVNEVESGQIPSCFRAGFKNWLKRIFIFRQWWSLEWIMTEDNTEVRYKPKTTLKHEFFYFDFGFSRFRNESDTVGVNEGFRDLFWSDEKDREDFGVNTEDGLYFWMYQKIRSNYVWFPGRDVELQGAICPGFWYTLLGWLLLMVISPAAVVGAYLLFTHEASWWVIIPTAIFGIVTPAWILAAAIRFLFELLVKLSTPLIKKVEEVIPEEIQVDKKYWENMAEFLAVTAIGAIVTAVLSGIAYVMWLWWYHSYAMAGFFTVFALLYVVYAHTNGTKYHKIFPWHYPFLGIPAVLFTVGKPLFDFRVEIWGVLSSVAIAIASFFATHWGTILFTLAVIAPSAVLFWGFKKMDNLEAKAWKGDKAAAKRLDAVYSIMRMFSFAVVGIGAVAFLYIGYHILTSPYMFDTAKVFVGLIAFSLVMSITWSMSSKFSPTVTQTVTRVSNNAEIMADWKDNRAQHFISNLVTRNEWLHTREDPAEQTQRLLHFVRNHFDLEDFPISLLTMDEKGFNVMTDYDRGLWSYGKKDSRRLISFMVRGISFEKAKAELEKEKEQANQFINRMTKLYDWTLGLLVHAIFAIIRWTGKFFRDIYIIWKDFNRGCAIWSEPRPLDHVADDVST